jgi:hypothetical protein
MKPIPAEKIVEELSTDLHDLLVREAFVRRRRQGLAAELEALRAKQAGLEGTRPAFLMFRSEKKEEFKATVDRLHEEIFAGERALGNCDLILKKCDKIIAKEIEDYLAQRSAEFRDLQAARMLLPGWQNVMGLYRSCLKRFITALGVARNQMSSGYDRKAGKFAAGSLEAFAAAVAAAKSLEAEASIPNKLAKRQRELLGLDPASTAAISEESAALPYVLGEGMPKQVAAFATLTLEVTARTICVLIDECERLHGGGIEALLGQVARIEGLLNAQWEQHVATPLVEIRAMADGMVEEEKMASVCAQMEKRFVTLTG